MNIKRTINLAATASMICAASVFAENSAKEPEEKDFTPEFVAQCKVKAEQGDAEAQCDLGVCHEFGNGVEKDLVKAVEWYRRAAEQGLPRAQYNLGVCYEFGKGMWKHMPSAIEWYTKAAEQGYAEAQCNLAVCFEFGTGVTGVMKNTAKAVEWYRRAAEQGLPRAQCNLGVCYEYGTGVEKDAAKAVEWYRKAAEQGHARGQCYLGECYEHGTGVEKDAAKAVEWYRRAAEQELPRAQCNLGVCYEHGTGVEKDAAKAVEWYAKAAEQGDKRAVKHLVDYAEEAKELPDFAMRTARLFKLQHTLQHTMVSIPCKHYMMCKYEVTQALWLAVMGNNPSLFKGADRPVDNVSWNDCQEFLEKLNAMPGVKGSGFTYRLPTEDEWEYACRAGGIRYRLADGTELGYDLGEVAWHAGNSDGMTHPVGQKKPNAFGLYDMFGNVWEWTSSSKRVCDSDHPILCGNCWSYSSSGISRPFNREWASPDTRMHFFGFRLAADMAAK